MDVNGLKEKVIEHLAAIDLSQLCLFEVDRYVGIIERVSRMGEADRYIDAVTAMVQRPPMPFGEVFGLGVDGDA